MKNVLALNLLLIFVLSLIIFNLVYGLVHGPNVDSDHSTGYIIGHAFASTAIPLLVTAVLASIYKSVKKLPMPGFVPLFWLLWVILTIVALFGETISGIQRYTAT